MTREEAIQYLLQFAKDNKYKSDEIGFLSGLIHIALNNTQNKIELNINEEKAKEIAEKNAIIYDAEKDTANGLIYSTIHSTEECKKSALAMAEWKDEQFKEYLENKRDSIELDYHKDSYEENAYKYYMLKEIINELFGETENVDNSDNYE